MAKEYVSLKENMDHAVGRAKEILESGGVVIFPTETVYGIGVLSGDATALEKLRRLKDRGPDKPFQFLVSDVAMATAMGAVFSTKAHKLARNYWPGPMTLVVPDGTGSGTLGIRIPDLPFFLALSRAVCRPIIASSANSAGAPPPHTAEEADAFGNEVDLLVDGGPVVDGGIPSTVVMAKENEYKILREGGVDAEDIESAWSE